MGGGRRRGPFTYYSNGWDGPPGSTFDWGQWSARGGPGASAGSSSNSGDSGGGGGGGGGSRTADWGDGAEGRSEAEEQLKWVAVYEQLVTQVLREARMTSCSPCFVVVRTDNLRPHDVQALSLRALSFIHPVPKSDEPIRPELHPAHPARPTADSECGLASIRVTPRARLTELHPPTRPPPLPPPNHAAATMIRRACWAGCWRPSPRSYARA
jgi:hypothetical protein